MSAPPAILAYQLRAAKLLTDMCTVWGKLYRATGGRKPRVADVVGSIDETAIMHAFQADVESTRAVHAIVAAELTERELQLAEARRQFWSTSSAESGHPHQLRTQGDSRALVALGLDVAMYHVDLLALRAIAEVASIQATLVSELLEVATSKGAVETGKSSHTSAGMRPRMTDEDAVEILNATNLEIASCNPFYPISLVGDFFLSLSNSGDRGVLKQMINEVEARAGLEAQVYVCKDVQRNTWLSVGPLPSSIDALAELVNAKMKGAPSEMPLKISISERKPVAITRVFCNMHDRINALVAGDMCNRWLSFAGLRSEVHHWALSRC